MGLKSSLPPSTRKTRRPSVSDASKRMVSLTSPHATCSTLDPASNGLLLPTSLLPLPLEKLKYGPEEYMGKAAQVIEMDGNFDNLQELVYIESALSNTKTKFYGELTQAMLALSD